MLCEDRRSQIGRSIDELILALEIDTFYSPEERHTIYLNRAYFGDDQFGIAAASEHYFSKGPDRLTVAESALLTSLPWAPAMLSPYKHPDQALARRNLVLASMQQQGSISAEVATMAEAAPLLTRQ
jgi:membrane peptidoglycan carboxypeptidase